MTMTRLQEQAIERLFATSGVTNVKGEPRIEKVKVPWGTEERPYYFVQAFFTDQPWNLYEAFLYENGQFVCQGHFTISDETRKKIFEGGIQ